MDGDRRHDTICRVDLFAPATPGGSRLAVQGAGNEVPGTVCSSSLTVLLPWAVRHLGTITCSLTHSARLPGPCPFPVCL